MPTPIVDGRAGGRADDLDDALSQRVIAIARRAGLDAVGLATAEPFDVARCALEERKAAGLHGGMHFTYGNPARSTDPERALVGARSLVVGASSYRREQPDAPRQGGPWARVARYSWADRYEPLRVALGAVAACLTDAGWQARVLVDDNALVDRAAAVRAGVGWYGKNANVLVPGVGSWFVLGSVVTDAPLVPSTVDEALADGCGSCTRCLPACPTGALVAPGVLDARRCLAWLLEAPGPFPREYRAALGDRLYGCDDCQEACPPNRLLDRTIVALGPSPGDEPWVDVVELLDASDTELMDRFGRWYIPRREPRYLRRNALVVLGNAGEQAAASPSVTHALRVSLVSDDSLVRSHAVWAAHRLGRADLIAETMAGECDPEVLDELRFAGSAP
ncbi:MAG TPA: tRNA epoxyqueuosine(34) reductase QueG [Acidimicrobiales bacterium]|nr:tRNA epoxyqueuosine(34) reductase QueG [Acidimicrobiales bacterium]